MRVEVNGARLFFDIVGSSFTPEGAIMKERPTFVVLHGGPGGDSSLMRPYFDRFADIVQVLYLDHRGNGRSSCDSVTMDLNHWADDVKGLCDILGIHKPIVLGSSFGGYVAGNYAIRYPDHPSKLVLLSTAARFHAEAVYSEFAKRAGPKAEAAARAFFANATLQTFKEYDERCMGCYTLNPPDPYQASRRTHSSVEQSMKNLVFNSTERHTIDLRSGLGTVRCPTLVLVGTEDPITPVVASQEIFESLPQGIAKLEIIPNAGHGIRVDQPDLLEKVIRNFLVRTDQSDQSE